MALDTKERKELVSTTMERLTLVIGASGNAEELVSLVTQIVKATKRLVEGTPEATKTRGTTTLAEFVFAAKKIAQDARAVDSSSLQQLSSTKRAVEKLVKELDMWYSSQQRKDDTDVALEKILIQPPQVSRQDSAPKTNGSRTSYGRGNTPETPNTDKEKKLFMDLKRQQDTLQQKSDPQRNPPQHGQPAEIIQTSVMGLQRGTAQLVEASGQRCPSKESILEPTILLARMVSVLMDLVDSLFVTKYPMRSQVHSFCCMLIDNALAYGEQSKSDDAASLRLISTQAPALVSALEVMVEQCHKRLVNIQESRKMSIQRGVDLHDLDFNRPGPKASPNLKKRKEPPVPPGKKEAPQPPPQDFDICCMICTNVAVDSKTHQVITKGTEIQLKANKLTSVKSVRKELSSQTGIPLDHIQLRFRGDDVLLDETKVTPGNALPYFMFNLYEPGEEELVEFKKEQRRKQRMRIDDVDWTKVQSPVAVALYDYESLGDGEDDNLEFEEGELIEITEKSADGWWMGKIDGKVGVIPASFIEEIQIPQSKEEAKKLVKKFKQGKLGNNNSEAKVDPISTDDNPPSHTPSPQPPPSTSGLPRVSHSMSHIHNPLPKLGSGISKAVKRIHSGGSDDYSKLSSKLNHRRGSDPPPTSSGKEKKEKKRGSLFKKKHTSNNEPIMEYQETVGEDQLSPLLSSPTTRKHAMEIPELNDEPRNGSIPRPAIAPFPEAVKRLSRPASSPRLSRNTDKISPTTDQEISSLKVKRRPPPPPPPFQNTYPRQMDDVEFDLELHSLQLSRTSPITPPITMQVTPASPSIPRSHDDDDQFIEDDDLRPLQSSNSMEELFRNLEEFDELASVSSPQDEFLDMERSERDFATIPRSELPPVREDVVEDDTNVAMPVPSMMASRQDSQDSLSQSPTKNTSQVAFSGPAKPPRKRSTKVAPPPPSSPSPPSSSLNAETSSRQMVENGLSKEDTSKESDESALPKPPPRRKSKKQTNPESSVKLVEKREQDSVEMRRQVVDVEVDQGSPALRKAAPLIPSKPGKVSPPTPSLKPGKVSPPTPSPKPGRVSPIPPPKPGNTSPSQGKVSPLLQRHSSPAVAPNTGKVSPLPPAKPRVSSKPVSGWRADLAVVDRPICSSAPVSRTVSPEDRVPLSANSRESSASTDLLARSPVVMRRTYAVNASRDPEFSDDELDECTGVGKEGVLHKEGVKKVEWKPRLFKITDDCINYYEMGNDMKNAKLLGQVPVGRMLGAVPIGEKDGFQCFALKMKYDTSVILGCHSRSDMDDWVKSVNKMIKSTKTGVANKTYSVSYKTAVKCITFLSEDNHIVEDKALIALPSSNSKVNKWLNAVDKGEDPDLSTMSDATVVACLLRSLFKKGRLSNLINTGLAKELCDLTQSANPISVLSSKLEKLPDDRRGLFKQLLRLFAKVLEHSHKNHTELDALNQCFGPLIFEKIASVQSEPLLAYLVSTCELIIS